MFMDIQVILPDFVFFLEMVSNVNSISWEVVARFVDSSFSDSSALPSLKIKSSEGIRDEEPCKSKERRPH